MTDRSILIVHAFLILQHGGELQEDCDLCQELQSVAITTAEVLVAQRP